MAKICKLEIERTEQYVIFDDCDSMTDYFHSTRGSLKYIISVIKEYGGNEINVGVSNNSTDLPAERRIKKICKECGYTAKNLSEEHIRTYSRYPDNKEMEEKYVHREWILTK